MSCILRSEWLSDCGTKEHAGGTSQAIAGNYRTISLPHCAVEGNFSRIVIRIEVAPTVEHTRLCGGLGTALARTPLESMVVE